MYIKKLPPELQRKILYYAMIHPTATLIKNIKTHYNIKQFEVCYDVENHTNYILPLYNLLVVFRILKPHDIYNDEYYLYEL